MINRVSHDYGVSVFHVLDALCGHVKSYLGYDDSLLTFYDQR